MKFSKTSFYFTFAFSILLSTISHFSNASETETAIDTSFYFNEVEGIIVAEIESLTPTSSWVEKGDRTGFTGTSFFEWTGSDQFGNPGVGLLNYVIKINSPGTYKFQWRCKIGHGSDNTEANDSWLRIPDADDFYGKKSNGHIVRPHGICTNDCPNGAGKDGWFKLYSSGTSNWTWTSRTSDNDAHTIYAEFDTAGFYTVQISGRSKYHLLDRLILHKTSVSNPTNLNLPETKVDNRDLDRGKVTFKVTNSADGKNISDATIAFNRTRKQTDGGGSAFYYNIKKETDLTFSIEKSAYIANEGSLIISADTVVYIELEKTATSNQAFNNGIQNTTIYPNPTGGNVKIKSLNEIVNISIYNTSGVQVFSSEIKENNETTINISHLKNGLYFVEINFLNGEKSAYQKLIKN